MEFNRYELEASGKIEAGPCVVTAPSPGAAVDYFLAIHGMLWYDKLSCKVTTEPADETKKDFTRICGALTPESLKELDDYHLPNIQYKEV